MKKLAKILLLGVMVCAAALPSFATDVSFTVFSDEEMNYYYYDMNSFDSGVTRYNDGDGFIIYEFPISEGDTHAQLTWRIRSQYKVSVTNTDPDNWEGYEVIHQAQPTEEELADQRPYWGDYEAESITVHDLSKWCENNTNGKIWVMMSDADPSNGWGGGIYKNTPVTFWSGTTEAPAVEQPKTKEELAADILAQYDFADGAQYFIAGTSTEKTYMHTEGGWINETNDRYHDNEAYTIYQFDVKASDTQALLHGAFNNQYVICATMGDPTDMAGYTEIAVAEPNEAEIAEEAPWWGNRIYTEDVTNADGTTETVTHYPVMDLDLSSVLNGTDGKLYVMVGDADTTNGWGGQVLFNHPVVFSTTGSAFASEEPAVEETEPAAEPETEEVIVETPAETTPAVEEVVEAPVAEAPQTFDAAVIALFAAAAAMGGAMVSRKRN